MYILQTEDDLVFKIVASIHPANVAPKYKRTLQLFNTSGNAEVCEYAVYTDTAWESLPCSKKYQYPRILKRGDC